jgi:hypothetical protein
VEQKIDYSATTTTVRKTVLSSATEKVRSEKNLLEKLELLDNYWNLTITEPSTN